MSQSGFSATGNDSMSKSTRARNRVHACYQSAVKQSKPARAFLLKFKGLDAARAGAIGRRPQSPPVPSSKPIGKFLVLEL